MEVCNLNIVPKTELAKVLGLSPRTIHYYHDVAYYYVEDFKCDYPIHNGKPYTRIGLTSYQCWVLREVINIGAKYPRKLIPRIITSDTNRFSKNFFLQNVNLRNNCESSIVEVS